MSSSLRNLSFRIFCETICTYFLDPDLFILITQPLGSVFWATSNIRVYIFLLYILKLYNFGGLYPLLKKNAFISVGIILAVKETQFMYCKINLSLTYLKKKAYVVILNLFRGDCDFQF